MVSREASTRMTCVSGHHVRSTQTGSHTLTCIQPRAGLATRVWTPDEASSVHVLAPAASQALAMAAVPHTERAMRPCGKDAHGATRAIGGGTLPGARWHGDPASHSKP